MGMVDRQQLRNTAKSAGESIAGTFKKGAKAAKSAAKTTKKGAKNIKDDVTGGADRGEIDLLYDQEREKYILVGPDNQAIGQYDDEMKAKAAARQAKRELQDTEETQSQSVTQKFKAAATNAAEGFDPSTPETESDSSPNIPMMGQTDQSGGPQVPMMFTDSGDSKEGPSLPFMNDRDTDGPEMPFMNDDTSPDLAFLDGGEGNGPTVPGFSGQQGDGGPQIVALDESREKPDTDRFPWY